MRFLKNFSNKLLDSKWIFTKPKKCKILIFDNLSFEHQKSALLMKFLKNTSYEILFTRYEKINLYILIKCFFKYKINPQSYYSEYINYCNPKIVINFMDNSRKFWMLNLNNNIKKIFIQAGLRCHFFADKFYRDNFNLKIKKKLFQVDYMFVINNFYGKKSFFNHIARFCRNSTC